MSTAAEREETALQATWEFAWNDYLHNRVDLAHKRAAPYLHLLSEALQRASDAQQHNIASETAAEMLADRLVTLADLHHISGAAENDTVQLRHAIAAYEAHLRFCPGNGNARRMRAECLLRCHDYAAAFAAFDAMYRQTLAAPIADETEVAPVQLLMDAECVEDAIRLGADDAAGVHAAAAANWRRLADSLCAAAPKHASSSGSTDASRRTPISALTVHQRSLLGAAFGKPLIAPPLRDETPIAALRTDIDWAAAQHTYVTERILVLDRLFSEPALARLQAYARHGAHFRSMRRGYLGAFPSDGVTHPLIRSLAEELERAAPLIFARHRLALHWFFKYDATNGEGIGIHADPAAVNINIWLTDDSACLEGGGLAIYEHVPPKSAATAEVNKEFAPGAEERLREQLRAAGPTRTVPYACNRAAIFISDQYHESLPFRFAVGYGNRRVNLTLLFGDRWCTDADGDASGVDGSKIGAEVANAATPSATAAADLWDVFD